MIGFISGKLLSRPEDNGGTVLVDVAGVGYEVHASELVTRNLTVGSDIRFFIHTHVREDALDLFGFSSLWDKKVFLALTSINGIGPRTGLSILNHVDGEALLGAIVRKDKAILQAVNGVGKKTADRLIVELGEKAQKLLMEKGMTAGLVAAGGSKKKTTDIPAQGAVSAAGAMAEAVAAMISLGYREGDAWTVVREVSEQADTELSTNQIIKTCLQRMAQK